MSDELKVVINLKGNRGSVGISAPDADPILDMVEGSLDEVLARVPELVARAREKWSASGGKRYPTYNRPTPPPAPIPPRTVVPRAAKPAEEEQHRMV